MELSREDRIDIRIALEQLIAKQAVRLAHPGVETKTSDGLRAEARSVMARRKRLLAKLGGPL